MSKQGQGGGRRTSGEGRGKVRRGASGGGKTRKTSKAKDRRGVRRRAGGGEQEDITSLHGGDKGPLSVTTTLLH